MDDLRADGELEFHFVRTPGFRVFHVDGVLGGPSPSGRTIHMAIYSERSPSPTKTVHVVSRGVLGHEVVERREMARGIHRDVEADLVMSIETAVALKAWLEDQIRTVERAQRGG